MCRPTRQGYRGRLIWLGARAKITPSCCPGVVAAACTQGKRTQHGKPQGEVRDDQPDAREGQAGRPEVAERFVLPLKPGNAGGGKELSSRQTQYVVRDLEIGQPNNSEKCSETADGVTRESEGRSRVSLLRAVRQDQPRRHLGTRLRAVSLEQGRTGGRRSGLRGRRGVWRRAVAWRTGACAPGRDLPTGPHQKSVHSEIQRQTQAVRYLNRARSGLHDSSDAGAGTDIRS